MMMTTTNCTGPVRNQCQRHRQIGMLLERPCRQCPTKGKAWMGTPPGIYTASDKREHNTIRKG